MKWSNIRLILEREVRDQLRDRRTLFMIAVLPLVLYPLLGMSFFQVTQFMRENAIRVLVINAPDSPRLPRLVEDDHFAAPLFSNPENVRLLKVTQHASDEADQPIDPLAKARAEMETDHFEVVVYFPPDFAERFARFHATLLQPRAAEAPAEPEASEPTLPPIEIFPNMAHDASQAAYRRVAGVLDRWRDEVGQQNLKDSQISPLAARPFEIDTRDVAETGQHKAALWSKILPFVLLIWALTGAFYPAVDLCAGEKERGTLETLLSSPAERLEIVWGKLLTVMLFSMATAILNLTSMAITGSFVLSQLPNFGPPPGLAFVWLLAALVPVSALFSALCLALAAFARSTKEGQYYLMPLVLVTMPLTILPMAPGVELNLGNSLIPITGVVLLLRSTLEGNYLTALPYLAPVAAVTLGCCWLAIRWATNQFNSEAVLFRESERWDVNLWVKHLLRDRESTPSFSEAMFCGVVILMIKFFLGFALPTPEDTRGFLMLAGVTQLVVVLTPALLMTIMLTRSPVRTLLLRRPPWLAPLAAVLLAVTLQPAVNLLHSVVMRVYPLNDQWADVLKKMEAGFDDNLWALLLVIGVLPAICEELAFRGFILSGFRSAGHKWTAIVLSSLFFGVTHMIFQQSLIAALVGIVLGFIAVQSGSLLPCVLFHCVHNSMPLLLKQLKPLLADGDHWLNWLMRSAPDDGRLFQWPVVLVSGLSSAAILIWFQRLPERRTSGEKLPELVDPHAAQWQVG